MNILKNQYPTHLPISNKYPSNILYLRLFFYKIERFIFYIKNKGNSTLSLNILKIKPYNQRYPTIIYLRYGGLGVHKKMVL